MCVRDCLLLCLHCSSRVTFDLPASSQVVTFDLAVSCWQDKCVGYEF
jgi:hypothetical protein